MKNIIGIAAMVLAAAASQAWAQGYPNKPVHVIISFTPGSSTDIVGRIVSQKLSEIWGQPVLAENRAGAGGSIGSNVVAKAAPDGYTLLVDSNAHTVTPSIYAKLPYDTVKDFIDIAPLSVQPNVLVVNAASPYKTLMDLVNAAKAKPSAINWGHAGVGSGTHLNTEKFVAAAKIDVTQIPFKGTPEVIQAMLSGSVDCYWAPAGTPANIVAKISADTRKALADPGVRERLGNLGNDTMDMSPEEFTRFVRSEIDEYARVIKAAGIKPQ